MKIFKSVFLGVVLLVFSASLSFASEVIKVQDGKECIDLKAVYEQNNLTSQAITGEEKSLDMVKRNETMTSLTNIIGLLLGDNIYCVNDEVAASKVDSFADQGIFGFLSDSTTQMFSIFNTIDVTGHLAEEFVPGYGGNNATLAQQEKLDCGELICSRCTPTPETINKTCFCNYNPWADSCPVSDASNGSDGEEAFSGKGKEINDKITDRLDNAVGSQDSVGDVQAEIDRQNMEKEDLKGYDYLKKTGLSSAWSVTRNIAYIFFVIVMIVIGFMIMFRNKIGGQIMVSVGNAIPRVILSLILVTFSFAIVGIMLDVGKVGIALVNGVFHQAESSLGVSSPEEVDISGITKLSDQAIYNLEITGSSKNQQGFNVEDVGGIGDAKQLTIENEGSGSTIGKSIEASVLLLVSGLIKAGREVDVASIPVIGQAGPLELLVDLLLQGIAYFTLAAAVRAILFLLVALYASIKLFITMLTTYFKIFVSVILAPIQLALGAIPGNQSGITNWFKSTFANILVFVVIVAVLRFFRFLSNAIDPADFNFYGNKGVFFPEGIVAVKGIFIIASYLVAANAPAMVSGFMKVEENKTMSAVGGATKASMSKIPVIGGMFAGK